MAPIFPPNSYKLPGRQGKRRKERKVERDSGFIEMLQGYCPSSPNQTDVGGGRSGSPPPVGGRGQRRGHRDGDEAAAAGHSAPSPPARTTSGRVAAQPARLPGAPGRRWRAPWPAPPPLSGEDPEPKPARVSAVSQSLASRKPQRLETCMSTPTCSKGIGHCWDKKQ